MSKKQDSHAYYLPNAGFLHDFFFDAEDGGDMYLQNIIDF
jgi:hypothetical protein